MIWVLTTLVSLVLLLAWAAVSFAYDTLRWVRAMDQTIHERHDEIVGKLEMLRYDVDAVDTKVAELLPPQSRDLPWCM